MVHFFDFAVEGVPMPRVDDDNALHILKVAKESFEDKTDVNKYSPDANNMAALLAAKKSVAKVSGVRRQA